MKQSNSIAQDRRASGADAVGHLSVQPWSAGPLFPCIIARVERYYDDWQGMHDGQPDECINAHVSLASRLQSVSYLLTAYGREEEYATREDAEKVARALNVSPAMRAAWQRGGVDSLKAREQWGIRPREVVGDFHGQAIYADEMDQRARDAGAL